MSTYTIDEVSIAVWPGLRRHYGVQSVGRVAQESRRRVGTALEDSTVPLRQVLESSVLPGNVVALGRVLLDRDV